MNDSYDQLRSYSAVKRFHIMRTLRSQTTGEHSHGVALLVMQVEPECTAVLLKAALTHDMHERDTGDMPSTAKWLYPELATAMQTAENTWNRQHGMNWQLTGHERSVLRWCDYLELLMWSTEELKLGNRYAVEAIVNICRVLDSIGAPTSQGAEIYTQARMEAENFTPSTINYLITQLK